MRPHPGGSRRRRANAARSARSRCSKSRRAEGVDQVVGDVDAGQRARAASLGVRGVAADDLDVAAQGRSRRRSRLPGHHPHPVPRGEQLRHQPAADVAGGPGDEAERGGPSRSRSVVTAGLQLVDLGRGRRLDPCPRSRSGTPGPGSSRRQVPPGDAVGVGRRARARTACGLTCWVSVPLLASEIGSCTSIISPCGSRTMRPVSRPCSTRSRSRRCRPRQMRLVTT